jgi:hypothetical protein
MIEAAERFADGQLTDRQFFSSFPTSDRHRVGVSAESVTRMAVLALNWPDHELPRHALDEQTGEIVPSAWEPGEYAEHYTSRICLHAVHAETLLQLGPGHRRGAAGEKFREAMAAVDARHVELFRDVIGNPFRPVAFSPSWRTTDAVGLARSMYDARDFAAMPILADALEDAGCDSADVLAHCRGDGPHVRGCWVVDLVLGKG